MAFPTTGVLDNFNRAAIGANWTEDPYGAGYAVLAITGSTQLTGSASNSQGGWNVATYGPAVEAYITIATKGADTKSITMCFRTSAFASTADEYEVDLKPASGASNDAVKINRYDDGVATQLGATITQEFANGDALGFEAIGSAIKVYRKPSGGSWAELGSRTDATYSSAGYMSVYIQETSWVLDDYGGGTVVSGLAVPIVLAQYRQRRQ